VYSSSGILFDKASKPRCRLAAYSRKEINLNESLSFRTPFAIMKSSTFHLTSAERKIIRGII